MTLNKMDDTLSQLHKQIASEDPIVGETHKLFFETYSLYEELQKSFHELEDEKISETAFLEDLSDYKIRGESLSDESLNLSFANHAKIEQLVNALIETGASIQDCIRYYSDDVFLKSSPEKRRLLFQQRSRAVDEEIQKFVAVSKQVQNLE